MSNPLAEIQACAAAVAIGAVVGVMLSKASVRVAKARMQGEVTALRGQLEADRRSLVNQVRTDQEELNRREQGLNEREIALNKREVTQLERAEKLKAREAAAQRIEEAELRRSVARQPPNDGMAWKNTGPPFKGNLSPAPAKAATAAAPWPRKQGRRSYNQM
ncbi:hypothetical protein LJR084_007308 [Variovorax sp. LjRoot84]|uniref:hypothetical protein n=1 Tax=Variovorax sp. LjRoot84 TaxID=3342340 RepID=UPI003ECE8F77